MAARALYGGGLLLGPDTGALRMSVSTVIVALNSRSLKLTKERCERYKCREFDMKFRIILLMVALSALLVSCGSARQGNGVLEGNVSIGPITPVQPTTPVPTPPEVYAARKVLVYDSRQSKLLYAVSLDDNGNYHIVLKPGTYVIDINHAGIDRSSDVPKTIEIEPGSTVTLNISIDTGLR